MEENVVTTSGRRGDEPAGTDRSTRRRAFWRWIRSHPYSVMASVLLAAESIRALARSSSEFESVYVAAARRLLGGEPLYTAGGGYAYPPFMAFAAIPFLGLPRPAARLAWFAVSAACLVFLVRSAWRLSGGTALEGEGRRPRHEHVIWLLGLACGLRYAFNALSHQQTDLVIGALLLGGCLALFRGRPLSSAALFGVAAGMKGTALLWCAYFLWRRRWRAAVLVPLVAVGINVLPDLVRSPASGGFWMTEWLTRYVAPMARADHDPGTWGSAIIFNQSLAGTVNRWTRTEWTWAEDHHRVVQKREVPASKTLRGIVYGTEVLLVIVAAFLLGRGQFSRHNGSDVSAPREAFEYSVVLILMLLLSPMSGKAHFAPLLLPGFSLARLALTEGRRRFLFLLLASIAIQLPSLHFFGERVSTLALWHGVVTLSLFPLMFGCGLALAELRRGRIVLSPRASA